MENGYYSYLRGLLIPLGVYDTEDDSLNMAELRVLGQALDDACSTAETLERECFMSLGQSYGLDMYEAILPKSGAETLEERRNAVLAMLTVNGAAANVGLLGVILNGGIADVELSELSSTRLGVRFTDPAPTGDRLAAAKSWIERLLPCHLEIVYE